MELNLPKWIKWHHARVPVNGKMLGSWYADPCGLLLVITEDEDNNFHASINNGANGKVTIPGSPFYTYVTARAMIRRWLVAYANGELEACVAAMKGNGKD